MSMHKIPLTPLEEEGLKKHGLDIGTPSQLSDAFRLGVKWANDNAVKNSTEGQFPIYDQNDTTRVVGFVVLAPDFGIEGFHRLVPNLRIKDGVEKVVSFGRVLNLVPDQEW